MQKEHRIIQGALSSDFNEVRDALLEDPDCVNEQNESGQTAAHISTLSRNFGFCRKL